MRLLSILVILFYSSCKTAAISSAIKTEIQLYNLENADTLVDIGCGDAYHDKQISYIYPNLFFILEDLAILEYHSKKWQPEKTNTYSTKLKVYQTFKNSTGYPNIESHFKLVIGFEDSIPLPSSTFNRILCRRTLHEFKNKEKMISEIIRILRPNGTVTIVESDPKYQGEQDAYCGNSYLTKEEITIMFKDLTFKGESIAAYPSGQLNILSFTK